MFPIRLHFLGTGTSTGVPQIGCHCAVCTSSDPRDSRLRTSALVETPEGSVLLDCGPDFRWQMLSLLRSHPQVPAVRAVLLTHEHYDHVGGLDDLRPYSSEQAVRVYADELCARHQRERMPYCFVEKKYPGVPNLSLHAVRPGQCIEACGMELTPFQVIHGRLPILAWRNRSRWAYITDLSHMPPEALPQLRGVNTLIINALRHEPHGSHQSLPEALQLISEIQPHRAYLIHASHQIGLHADLSAKLPPHVMMAYDGLTIEL